MSDNNYVWFFVAIMFTSASILLLSTRINQLEDNNTNSTKAPSIWDIRNNQTQDMMFDIKYINVCRETFPEGYNHRIHVDKCIVTFWRSDIEAMNNTNDN